MKEPDRIVRLYRWARARLPWVITAALFVVLLTVVCAEEAEAQEDTTVTMISSDTAFMAKDSVLVDSVPITATRVDTVGWDYVYRTIPGSRIITDIWRFVITMLLGCSGCVPADTVPTAPPAADSVPPIGAVHPNEPAGFTRFYENAYTVAPLHGIGNDNGAAIDGCWWKWDSGGKIGVSGDPTAPSGDGMVLDLRFPVGQPSGSGPGLVQEWDQCGESSNTEYSKVYVDLWIKMAGGPNGDLLDWEQHPVATKLTGFWGSGRNNQGANASDMFGNIWNNGSGNLFQTDWAFNWINSHFPVGARSLPQNVNTQLRIRAGQWHRIEILMEMNSTPGSTDGVFKWWLDGTLALDYSDVVYNSLTSPGGFYGRHNSPTWGGASVNPKTREDHIYYDTLYMSATP